MWVSLGSAVWELSQLPGPACLRGEFLAIISSNKLFTPFSFSSSGTPIMQLLTPYMLSHKFLKLSSLFFILFSFCYSGLSSSILSFSSLILSSASSALLLNPSSVFFGSGFVCTFHPVTSVWCFSYCAHSFFSQVSWTSLWPLLWIFYQKNYLLSFH